MYKFHRNSCDLVEGNEWIGMAGNITKVQREEEGRKGRKYGDTVTLCLLSFTDADSTPTSLIA